MNNIVQSHTSPTQTGTGASAFEAGEVMPVERAFWPESETPGYGVAQTESSYSQGSEQLMKATSLNTHADFTHDAASIYASLSKRQERLGEEFEAAIFHDLDSLYES